MQKEDISRTKLDDDEQDTSDSKVTNTIQALERALKVQIIFQDKQKKLYEQTQQKVLSLEEDLNNKTKENTALKTNITIIADKFQSCMDTSNEKIASLNEKVTNLTKESKSNDEKAKRFENALKISIQKHEETLKAAKRQKEEIGKDIAEKAELKLKSLEKDLEQSIESNKTKSMRIESCERFRQTAENQISDLNVSLKKTEGQILILKQESQGEMKKNKALTNIIQKQAKLIVMMQTEAKTLKQHLADRASKQRTYIEQKEEEIKLIKTNAENNERNMIPIADISKIFHIQTDCDIKTLKESLVDIEKLSNKNNALENSMTKIKMELNESISEYKSLQQERDELEQKLLRTTKDITEFRESMERNQNDKKEYEGIISNLKEKNTDLEEEVAAVKKNLEEKLKLDKSMIPLADIHNIFHFQTNCDIETVKQKLIEIEQFMKEKNVLKDSVTKIQTELNESLSKYKSLKQESVELEQKLKKSTSDVKALKEIEERNKCEMKDYEDVISKLKEKNTNLEEEVSTVKKDLDDKINSHSVTKLKMEDNLKANQEEIEKLTSKNKELEESVTKLQKELNDNLNVHKILQDERDDLDQKLKNARNDITKLEKSMEQNKRERNNFEDIISNLKDTKKELEEEVSSNKKDFEKKLNGYNVAKLKMENDLKDSQDKNETYSKEVDHLSKTLEKIKKEMYEIANENESLRKDRDTLSCELQVANQENNANLEMKEELTAVQAANDKLINENNELTGKISRVAGQMEANENQIKDYEGIISNLKNKNVQLAQGMTENTKQLKQMHTKLEDARDEVKKANSSHSFKVSSLESTISFQQDKMNAMEQKLKKSRVFIEELMDKTKKLSTEIMLRERALDTCSRKTDRYKSDNTDLKERVIQLQKGIEKAEEISSRVPYLENKLSETEANLQYLETIHNFEKERNQSLIDILQHELLDVSNQKIEMDVKLRDKDRQMLMGLKEKEEEFMKEKESESKRKELEEEINELKQANRTLRLKLNHAKSEISKQRVTIETIRGKAKDAISRRLELQKELDENTELLKSSQKMMKKKKQAIPSIQSF